MSKISNVLREGVPMAEFSYVAVGADGRQIKGNISANDAPGARAALKAQKMVVLSVTEANIMNREINFTLSKKIKDRDLGIFCRQMYSIVTAGVTVERALDMLAGTTENKNLKKAIGDARDMVRAGESLSNGLKANEEMFPRIMIFIIQAGEESGSLENSFERLSTHFEKRAKLSGLIKKAMIYPIVIVIVAFAVVMVMSIVVIPQFASMFEELGAEMPFMTQMVLAFSNLIMYQWYILLAIGVIAAVAFKFYAGTDIGKHQLGRLSMKLPIFGELNIKNACASICRTMATLLGSGMMVPRALEITADSMSNVIYRDALLQAKTLVEGGVALTRALKETEEFPAMVENMLSIGEETGSIENMLERAAEYYEDEVETTTGALTAAMEPLIIVVMGVIVGIIVMAIYQPMISMYQNLDNL